MPFTKYIPPGGRRSVKAAIIGQVAHHVAGDMEPEDRPANVSPQPPGSFEDLVAEMWANDPEAQEWRRNERLAEAFGNTPFGGREADRNTGAQR